MSKDIEYNRIKLCLFLANWFDRALLMISIKVISRANTKESLNNGYVSATEK